METTSNPGKTTAIIAYLTIIGWIIAFIMNNKENNTFASFHIRQALGLMLTYFAVSILISLTGIWMLSVLYLVVFIFVILGIIAAVQEEEKTVPVLGDYFQDWFKSIG